MATLTKKAIAQLSQEALEAIIRCCPFRIKLLNLLAANLDQKNIQARIYASSHLKTVLQAQAPAYQSQIATSMGLETLLNATRKALSDANADVRENGRAMFHALVAIWPTEAQILHRSLDAAARKQLDKVGASNVVKVLGAGARTVSATSGASGRPSMRALISQRRAAAQEAASQSVESFDVKRSAPSIPRTPVGHSSGINDSGRPASTYSPAPSKARRSATDLYADPSTLGSTSTSSSPASQVQNLDIIPRKASASTAAGTVHHKASQTPQPASPTLQAMMLSNNDYSTFEGYTMELAHTVPLPNDMSTDGESIGSIQIGTPAKALPEGMRQQLSTRKLEPTILDHLHDTTILGNDSFEVDEAVQGRAEQAEQAAHRFLELVEPDEAETTVLHVNGNHTYSSGPLEEAIGSPTRAQRVQDNNTPLLNRLADLHLKDSPASNGLHTKVAKARQPPAANSWWLMKSESKNLHEIDVDHQLIYCLVDLAKVRPIPVSQLPETTAKIETNATTADLITLARFSADHADRPSPAIWLDNRLYTRLLDTCCHILRQSDEASRFEPTMMLLLKLVTCQTDLLGGREGEIASLLLELRRNQDKNIAAAVQVVMQMFVGAMDTLYGLATLRSSLDSHLAEHRQPNGSLDAATANSYSTGLEAFGRLFLDLPSEVLEEEIIKARDLIKEVRIESQVLQQWR